MLGPESLRDRDANAAERDAVAEMPTISLVRGEIGLIYDKEAIDAQKERYETLRETALRHGPDRLVAALKDYKAQDLSKTQSGLVPADIRSLDLNYSYAFALSMAVWFYIFNSNGRKFNARNRKERAILFDKLQAANLLEGIDVDAMQHRIRAHLGERRELKNRFGGSASPFSN